MVPFIYECYSVIRVQLLQMSFEKLVQQNFW